MKTGFRLIAGATCIALLANCATQPAIMSNPSAAATLREARSAEVPLETRVSDYLEAASLSLPRIASETETYNSAAAELTILLRSGEGGRLWNHPLTLTGNNKTYHLPLQPAQRGTWSPDYFTSFEDPRKMSHKLKDASNVQPGVGGSLVGVRSITPREPFTAPQGMTAPVT